MKKVILNREDIKDRLRKIASEIVEKYGSIDDIVLVGIRTGGAYLANRLQKEIFRIVSLSPPVGILDITLYRDDWTSLAPAPIVKKTEMPCSLNGKTVILVDDVLYTGRTVRAAMDAIMDYGRPCKIELAVLADRGEKNRELPIAPNYTGGVWDTSSEETINVYLEEQGFFDNAVIEKRGTLESGTRQEEKG
jgi:pyrimidine operon attenuation protein/uracil phosphoribosyltransferase